MKKELQPDYKFTTLEDLALNAVRTESLPTEIRTSATFNDLLDVVAAVGNIVDQFKKNFYYNQKFDNAEKYSQTLDELAQIAIDKLKNMQEDFRKGEHLVPAHTIVDSAMIRALHVALGLVTESTEIVECLQSAIGEYSTGIPDLVNFKEELGDAAWYVMIGSCIDDDDSKQGTENLQSILEKVINKLRIRFPTANFDEFYAKTRDLIAERELLEK